MIQETLRPPTDTSAVKDLRKLIAFLDFFRGDLDWLFTNLKESQALFHPQLTAYLSVAWREVRPQFLSAAQLLVDGGATTMNLLNMAGLAGHSLQFRLTVVSVHREKWYNLRRSTSPSLAKGRQLRRYLSTSRAILPAVANIAPPVTAIRDFVDSLSWSIRDDSA
jgi:hypothetical protein